jgi:hypothetical protein
MSSRPITPVSPVQSSRLEPSIHSARPTSARISSRPVSYAGTQHTQHTQPIDGVPQLSHPQAPLEEHSEAAQTSNLHDEVADQHDESPVFPRSNSHMSGSQNPLPTRGGTLKKKGSLHKSASLKRTASKRSSYAGSVRSMQLGEKEKYDETPETNSVFYSPVPTTGNPTELLATRFQGMNR